MDVSTRSKTLLNEDQRWMGNGGKPIGEMRSIVLDRSLFDLENTFPNGVIPSGVALGKVAATGLYGPYGGTTDEVVTLTVGGSGLTSFTLTFGGQTTSSIDDQADGDAVQAALEALSTIGEGNVSVTGPAGGPWVVTFQGDLADTNVGGITTTPTGGTGTVTPAVTTSGGAEGGTGGLETMVGHLGVSLAYDPNSSGDLAGALFWSGEVIEEFLPANHGLDDNGKAEVANHIAYV